MVATRYSEDGKQTDVSKASKFGSSPEPPKKSNKNDSVREIVLLSVVLRVLNVPDMFILQGMGSVTTECVLLIVHPGRVKNIS